MRKNPAPIDPSLLEPVLAPFGTSTTLPAVAYLSKEVLSWEQQRFFTEAWVCIGRVSDFPSGTAKALLVGTEPVLVVSDEEATIRAFFNVCRHRGHELLPLGEARSVRLLRCPYHSWSYALDGVLRSAPTFGDALDRDRFGLGTIPTEEWHGWLFVDASGAAPSLSEQVGNLEEYLAPYRPERLLPGRRQKYEVRANWKIIVENYQECYHCSNIHPALCKVTSPESGRDLPATGLWCGGPMELEDHAVTMSMDGSSAGVMLPGLSPEQQRQVLYLTLFPNLLISPHPDYVMAHRITPVGPDRSLVECEWLFDPEAVSDERFDPSYAVEFWDLTNREDWAACEGVQRGIRSLGYRPGPLSSWETTLYQFLHVVAAAYSHGELQPPPFPGSVAKT